MNDPPSLSRSVVRGGLWLLALRIVNRGLGLLRTLVLARVLLPADFGLIGIGLLAASTLETFSATGFSQALVQRTDDSAAAWDTAFWVALVRGLALSALLWVAAPWIAGFFHQPEAAWIIRAMGVAPLLRGLTNPGVIRYQKEMAFGRQFGYEFGITAADAALAIPLALVYRSAWALVGGYLAGQAVGVALSWLVHPWRVRLRFDRETLGQLSGFGRYITGSTILIYALTEGFDLLVGRWLGASLLGLYQMAFRLGNLPTTEIANLVSRVTLPAYARLQQDPARVGAAFLRVLRLSTLVSFPFAGLVMVLGPQFVRTALGAAWEPMIVPMQVLALYGLIGSVGASTAPVFLALGKPALYFRIMLLKLAIMAVTAYPMITAWGLSGAAWAIVGNALISNPLADYVVLRETGGRLRDFLAALRPAVLTALAMSAAAAGISALPLSGSWQLLLGGAAALAAGGLAIFFLERRGQAGLWAEARVVWLGS